MRNTSIQNIVDIITFDLSAHLVHARPNRSGCGEVQGCASHRVKASNHNKVLIKGCVLLARHSQHMVVDSSLVGNFFLNKTYTIIMFSVRLG